MSKLKPSQRTLSKSPAAQQTISFVKFKVPAAEQAELGAIVQSTYGDIVIAKA